MAFQIFEYTPEIDAIVENSALSFEKMDRLAALIGDSAFPSYLRRYIMKVCPHGQSSVALHPSFSIAKYADADQDRIERKKGFIGSSDLQRGLYPNAIHHLKVYHNARGKARLFYKFEGSIQFIKNLKNGP